MEHFSEAPLLVIYRHCVDCGKEITADMSVYVEEESSSDRGDRVTVRCVPCQQVITNAQLAAMLVRR